MNTRLCHVYCLYKIFIQKGIIYVNLLYFSIEMNSQSKDDSNGAGFYHKNKGFKIVDSKSLLKTLVTNLALYL